MKDSLGKIDFIIPEDAMAELDEVSAIKLGFPHDFLAGEYVQDLVYNVPRDSIDG
jgi:hypothetical protein